MNKKVADQIAGHVAIERHLARPTWQAQEVYCLAVLVHGAIEVVPFAADTDVRFIDSPGGVHASCPAIPSLLELRHVADHPTQNRRVRHDEPPLSHHGREISIAQSVRDVPAHAQLNDLALESPSAVDRVARYRLGHSGTPVGARILRRRRQCTRTIVTDVLGKDLILLVEREGLEPSTPAL
jgi:hypothetical protein